MIADPGIPAAATATFAYYKTELLRSLLRGCAGYNEFKKSNRSSFDSAVLGICIIQRLQELRRVRYLALKQFTNPIVDHSSGCWSLWVGYRTLWPLC